MMAVDTSALMAILQDEPQAHACMAAIERAGLNYGDCFSYALARERNLPLFYIGQDFAQTDVQSAL